MATTCACTERRALIDPTIIIGSTPNPIAAHDVVQYTTGLAAGAQQRVEGIYNGFDAQVTRYVRDASGALIHTDTFYSHYHPVNGLLLIGKSG